MFKVFSWEGSELKKQEGTKTLATRTPVRGKFRLTTPVTSLTN